MPRRIIVPVLFLSLAAISCQRLESTRPFEGRGRGEVAIIQTPFRDAIPLEYGDLVGVTTRSDSPGWTQAWFAKPDKSIVIVWVNSVTGDIYEKAYSIPRR